MLLTAPGVAAAWEEVTREQGVVVHQQEVKGQSIPKFRGTGVVRASVYEVLAVLNDVPRRLEWQHRCVGSHLIERRGHFEAIQYNRTDSPWPAEDRDVVVHSHIYTYEPGRSVIATFLGVRHPRKPKVDDAIRMPRLQGFYKLEALGERRTRVTYQVDADPGGWIPGWLAKRATRELPLKTILGLRKAVRGASKRYRGFLELWDPKYRDPDAGPPPAAPPPYPYK